MPLNFLHPIATPWLRAKNAQSTTFLMALFFIHIGNLGLKRPHRKKPQRACVQHPVPRKNTPERTASYGPVK